MLRQDTTYVSVRLSLVRGFANVTMMREYAIADAIRPYAIPSRIQSCYGGLGMGSYLT